ncbi:MAG: hypothetical protein IIC82_07525 [Chloroflexi bacterium]|nr:hypothetical protein [Chloroflexota bacterium]
MTTLTERQLPLSGLELRDQGIGSVSRHNPAWLNMARNIAVATCRIEGYVTSDLVHDVMGPPPHDNCYGAIFKDKRFVATGERVKSTRREAHGRWIQIWRLR